MIRTFGMLMVVALAVTTIACSSDTADEPLDPDFAGRLDDDINRAHIAGAHEAQVTALAEAQKTGEITFEAYTEAIDRALRCARENGDEIVFDTMTEHLGVQLRTYSVSVDQIDEQEPLTGFPVHRCVAEHSFWVERLYQLQPTSLEAAEAHYEQYREAIVDCLANHEIDVEPDLTYEELSTQFSDVNDERTHIFGQCLDESGYSRS